MELKSTIKRDSLDSNRINNSNNGLLTDPLGGSSLLNYINYNYKINQIKSFTNYAIYN